MLPYKHSRFDEEILEAMMYYNANNEDKFTLTDARILSLIHSYAYNNKLFFASNRYLADKCLTTQPTVQKSINKLIAHGLVSKAITCINGRKQRILTYNETAINEFKLWAAPQATVDITEDKNWIEMPDHN